MTTALAAQDFRSPHAMTDIEGRCQSPFDSIRKTWPAAMALELLVRFEQQGIAVDAAVFAVFKVIPESAGESAFSALFPQDVLGQGNQ